MCKIKYGIFFFIVLFQLNIQAKVTTQQEYIDSLITVAATLPNDSAKVVLLERIGYFYISLNPTEGKKYTTKALELARELGLKNREAASIALLAANYAANSEYDKALQYNFEAIKIFKSLNNQKANMDLAREVLRVSRIKYKEGVGSSIEVTQAQTELETAENNYIQALYNALVSKVDLDNAYGRIQ